jgi:DNA-binding SARP family transcriptional activator
MSRKILELDVYNEKAHYYIMKQYIRENNIELARKNYKNLETLFRKDLGIDPNISLKELLHQSQQQENERRLEAIQSTFQQFKSKQAFECSAEEFRQLCEIEKRRAQRERLLIIIL